VLWELGIASVVINLLALETPLFLMTVYNHALANERISGTNPAVGVKTAAKADPASRRREFTLDEARTVLSAARGAKAELRWLVWLVAVTGARIAEIASWT
jgi:integrase